MIRNPILRGFHPDPSWTRVGEWTYLVASTFAWLPGLPVYRSRDLVHWEALPPAIPDGCALGFAGCACDDGLYAPGLRHDGQRFLLACTLVQRKAQRFRNFICTSTCPEEGWADPVMLPEGIGRIDPTPFIDDDGSHWLVLNDLPVPEFAHGANRSIRLWRLDARSLQPTEGPFTLWHGAMVNAATPEAPRLFRRGGWYWLLIAEGGTGRNHAVTMARSRVLTGPYESCPANPLLTHRHLGPHEAIQCVGHADLLQGTDGRWWACCLATRQADGHGALGRETWVLPVDWPEGEWPVFAPGEGRLRERLPAPVSSIAGPVPSPAWIGLRAAPAELATFEGPETCILKARPHAWDDAAQAPALIGRRIPEHSGTWRARLDADADFSHGIAFYCSDRAWLALAVENKGLTLRDGAGTEHARVELPSPGPIVLAFAWKQGSLQASWSQGGDFQDFGPPIPLASFARPVFAGAVSAVWAQGETGSLRADTALAD